MTYHTLDDWLGEIENYGTRSERVVEECGTDRVLAWLETAWRLGAEAERWAVETNRDMAEAAKISIRELLDGHGVPAAAFIDDHVANAIAQRNILANSLVAVLEAVRGGPQHETLQQAVASANAALANAYPTGIELRALGESVVRHLKEKGILDDTATSAKGRQQEDTAG